MFRREVLKGVLGVAAVPVIGEHPIREVGRLRIQFNAAWCQKTVDPGVFRRLTVALLNDHGLQPSTNWTFWVLSGQAGLIDGIELRTDKLHRGPSGTYSLETEAGRMIFYGVPVT